jgi:hypothetical protein
MAELAELGRSAAGAKEAARCRQQADDAEVRLKPLRDLVLDPIYFGTTRCDRDGVPGSARCDANRVHTSPIYIVCNDLAWAKFRLMTFAANEPSK